MRLQMDLVHESTLLGAIDSYLKELVHVRPFLVQRYSHLLEAMADRWLAEGGGNALSDLDGLWLKRYIAECADQATAGQIVQAFYCWACQRNLMTAKGTLAG